MKQKLIINMIALLLICISLTSYAADLNELQDQKNVLQEQIDETNQELNNVNEELTQNLKQIAKLDESIEKTNNTLNDLNNNITSMQSEIDKIEKDLKKTTKKYKKQKKLLDSRIIAMYETESNNYLDAIVGTRSITDFISSYYLISEITAYDMDLLETVEKEKNEIEQKDAALKEQKEKLETEKRTSQKTEIALSNTKLLRENYISKLSEEEKQIQAKIDEYNNQINEVEAEIRALAATINFGEDYRGGQMQWPIYGHYKITSNYGMRVHPITGVYKLHTGVDISATIGTDFTAIADGVVVKAEPNRAYGNMVIIDHGGGVQTLYAHGSQIVATLGQEVKAGDVVLKVGSTGYSTGPHAHFEVRINGNPVNPLEYVQKPE